MYRLTLAIFVALSTCTYGAEWKSLIANVAAAESKIPELAPVEDPIVEIKLVEPVSTKLVRLDGPRHYGPHPGCEMCLGNHLVGTHRQARSYLNTIGYSQWVILHDNLHNRRTVTKSAEVVRAPTEASRAKTVTRSNCANGQCKTRNFRLFRRR
jgi:hypothetical protein